MWEIKSSQARTSELFSSMWRTTKIFREVKEKLTTCLLKSNCHTNAVISQVSQIYIAALIWFPALYFQCHFESVTFHWVYQGKARMVFKLKKQERFSILKISGKGSIWASIRVISKGVLFSSAHCSSQWTGRPLPINKPVHFGFFP